MRKLWTRIHRKPKKAKKAKVLLEKVRPGHASRGSIEGQGVSVVPQVAEFIGRLIVEVEAIT